MKKRLTALLLAACMALSLMGLPALATSSDNETPILTDAPSNPFTDVKSTSAFLPGILYAVEKGITNGTTSTTFSPSVTCTRAQILTFLWRAWGSPQSDIKNPFSDLTPEAYYYQAALWAYEKELVSGTTFDAYAPCTRLEAVTYLWKLDGAPQVYETYEDTFPFKDLSNDADALNAVAWAAMEKAITNGTSKTTFAPDNVCTRGQIVTFLYRARELFENQA